MGIYYLRADGGISTYTVPLTSLPTMDPDSPSSCLSFAGWDIYGGSVPGGSTVVISGRGGPYFLSPGHPFNLSGGVDSANRVAYQPEEGFDTIFDGNGSVSTLMGLQFAVSGTTKRFARVGKFTYKNWTGFGFLCKWSDVILDGGVLEGITGSTFLEVTDTGGVPTDNKSKVIVSDIHGFGGHSTHFIGVHGYADLQVNRCSGFGGKVCAIHTIDQSSAEINDVDVVSPVTGGTTALLLTGTGLNKVNRGSIIINKSGYNGLKSDPGRSVEANHLKIIFEGSADAGSIAVGSLYESSGIVTLNNCLVANKGASGTPVAIRGTGTSGAVSAITANNTIFSGQIKIAHLNYSGDTATLNNCCRNNTIDKTGVGTFTENNPVNADPKFVSVSDFHLQPGSPCLGTGAKIPRINKDAENNPLYPPYNIGPYGLSAGALGVAPVANDGPPRNNITRLTGEANTIDPAGTYQFSDTNAWREVTGWTAGTANDFFDADGVPIPFLGQKLIDAGIGYQLYYGQKGVAGYTIEQDAKSHKKIVKFLRVNTYLDSILYDPDQDYNW